MEESVVHYYSSQTSKCGYCKGIDRSQSYGMHAYVLSTQDYQHLIDRGWRRCGCYCYKPNNKITCCPSYTIKCDTLNFKLSKSHKKVLKRMTRFLRDGVREKCDDKSNKNDEDNKDDEKGEEDEGKNKDAKQLKKSSPKNSATSIEFDDFVGDCENNIKGPDVPKMTLQELEEVLKPSQEQQQQQEQQNDSTETVGSSPESTKSDSEKRPPCKKAKHMRMERRQAKQLARGSPPTPKPQTSKCPEKSLKDFLSQDSETDKHKLKIISIAANDRHAYTDVTFKLYSKYQLVIHKDNPDRLTPANMQRFLHKSPLKLKLVHGQKLLESINEVYTLYQKYQVRVHNDPPENLQSYEEFLQSTPLTESTPPDGPEIGYGSFHQQYWLDDKLIAVGVIDILPSCLSSVYFFYDPDYSFLSLGTYGTLREIDLVHNLAQESPALKYYYMGYYIHSCPKMRYKGQLSSSYLLCPETYQWQLLNEIIRAKLTLQKYQRLDPDDNAVDENIFEARHLKYLKCFVMPKRERQSAAHFLLSAEGSNISTHRENFLEFGNLVGKYCARRLLFIQNPIHNIFN